MTENTKISWTDNTWNPWRGCFKVSPGCKQCYMYRDQLRYGNDPKEIIRAAPATFNTPLKWPKPALVFTCSWSDFFIEQADYWRGEAWVIIERTPHLTYQILTKRPENIAKRLPPNWGSGWDNVWLGVSVESKDYLNRIDTLASIPAKLHFVSYEPALEYVNFTPYADKIDWLISGGESGPNYRPANIDWFRHVAIDCKRHGITHFHKQHGGTKKINGEYGGYLVDGVEYRKIPTVSYYELQPAMF